MKKSLLLFFVIFFISTAFGQTKSYWSGDGASAVSDYSVSSDGKTYTIKTAKGLAWVSDQVNSGANDFGDKTIQIVNNINLEGALWNPIGNSLNPFRGSVIGKDGMKIISGLTVDESSSADICGGLVGFMKLCNGSGIGSLGVVFSNITVDGTVTVVSQDNSTYAAGLIGEILFDKIVDSDPGYQTKIAIYNCENNATVKSRSYSSSHSDLSISGGLVGVVIDNLGAKGTIAEISINNCKNKGEIYSYSFGNGEALSGGICGFYFSPFKGDISLGNILFSLDKDISSNNIYAYSKGNDAYAAGLIAKFVLLGSEHPMIQIINSAVTGKIKAESDLGVSFASGLVCSANVENAGNDSFSWNASPPLSDIEGDITNENICDNNGLNGSNSNNGDSGNTSESFLGVLIDLDEPVYNNVEYGVVVDGKTITLNKLGQDYTIKGGDNTFTINAESVNGRLWFKNIKIDNLKLGSGVSLLNTSISNSKVVIMYDGCSLGYSSLKNEGDILFHRTFKKFASGDNGWQSICLPFDAKLYYGDESIARRYFIGDFDNKGAYWLKEIGDVESDFVDFKYITNENCYEEEDINGVIEKRPTIIKSYTPYLIALPSDKWGEENDMSKKNIVFKGCGDIVNLDAYRTAFPVNGASVISTPHHSSVNNEFVLNINSELLEAKFPDNDCGGDKLYILGSDAIRKSFRGTVKIEGYVASQGAHLRIGKPTSTHTNHFEKDKTYVNAAKGIIEIVSSEDKTVRIYNLQGLLVKEVDVKVGESCFIDSLPSGFYIVDGVKVII